MSLINMKLLKDNSVIYNIENIEAEINEKYIKFELDNTTNIYELLEEGCIFTRENDEFRFKLDTIKKEATYLLKETNTLLDIIIEKCEYFVYPNKTKITYKLESDDCLNSIELTKGDN